MNIVKPTLSKQRIMIFFLATGLGSLLVVGCAQKQKTNQISHVEKPLSVEAHLRLLYVPGIYSLDSSQQVEYLGALKALLDEQRTGMNPKSLFAVSSGAHRNLCLETSDASCWAAAKNLEVPLYFPSEIELKAPAREVLKRSLMSGSKWLVTNLAYKEDVLQKPLSRDFIQSQWAKYGDQESKLRVLFQSWIMAPSHGSVHSDFVLLNLQRELSEVVREKTVADFKGVWVHHVPSNVLGAFKNLKSELCGRGLGRQVVLTPSGTSPQSTFEKAGCLEIYKVSTTTQTGLQLDLTPTKAEHMFLTVPLKNSGARLSFSPQINLKLEMNKSPQELTKWLADSYKNVTKADVSVVKESDVVSGLTAGNLSFDQLQAAIPGEKELFGFDISTKQLETGLCSAANKGFEGTGTLVFSGFSLVNAGTATCKLVGTHRSHLKVVVDQVLLEKTPLWLGRNMKGLAFKYGLKTTRAIKLQTDRNRGQL